MASIDRFQCVSDVDVFKYEGAHVFLMDTPDYRVCSFGVDGYIRKCWPSWNLIELRDGTRIRLVAPDCGILKGRKVYFFWYQDVWEFAERWKATAAVLGHIRSGSPADGAMILDLIRGIGRFGQTWPGFGIDALVGWAERSLTAMSLKDVKTLADLLDRE